MKLNISILQNDLDQRRMSAYLVREYRVLWLSLSQLASETGEKQLHSEMNADKSLDFPISPTSILITLLSHQS
jgi:hypothetical protein